MTTIQALIIALLQGLTELFPVSSLGHAVILPALLHWTLDERSLTFLPFLVMLHVGTAAALLLFFWRDWLALARGALGLADPLHVRESRHILMLIVIATIPAVILGYAFDSLFRTLFGTPMIAAMFLILNGLMLFLGERLRARSSMTGDRAIADLTIVDAVVIGCWQCVAFLPGISRSGATITGGLLRGIDHQASARFSFLIALPVIFAATASQGLKLHHAHLGFTDLQPAILGAIVAGVTAFASLAFLMRYFRNHDNWAMGPFAIYSIVAGAGSLLALTFL
ncbi:undecaprenyl-diphosphate phosphatase [Lichenicola cladoniae]|uniref:Undecaprenyl-diphosphatase n=1 Tax=Lichenicola cladoniae TaxID=1484109 RepID=A0A6M8HPP8_9PROT|nr:undecaprenyl-diphosphate phosphatase [Lichenicola cladoniae]NPD67845.1 undecaprenyl-diphosphate phosphatase [Acetobacteraceae bacterium]QKE90449.1 undecaprenyl-diphosphate phosphatase [Lichenicola cladoniae]